MKKLYKYVLPWIIVYALSFSFVMANKGDACAHAEEMIAENNMTETAENSQDEAKEGILEAMLTETTEEIVITPEKIGLHAAYVAKEEIEFLGENPYGAVTIDGNVMYRKDTGDKILTASADIETYLITGQSVYYTAGEYLYRYHIASGITDIMCNAPDTKCYSLSVITNRIVYMWVDNPEYVEGLETQAPIIAIVYDATSKTYHWGGSERTNAMAIEQIRYIENKEADRTQQTDEVKVGIYTINGKPIPLENYPSGTNEEFDTGWYFNTRLSESTLAQARLVEGNENKTDAQISAMAEYPGSLPCGHGGVGCYSKSYDGGTQCVGFANYVFDVIWDQKRTASPYTTMNHSIDLESIEETVAAFQAIPSGAYVWVSSSSDAVNGHSFIYVGCNISGITYYHGNDRLGNCHVSIEENRSWAEFVAQHNRIIRVTYPCQTHTLGEAQPHTNTQHVQTCTHCGVNVYTNHSITISQYDSAHHAQDCAVCGMRNPIAHVFDSYSSNGDSGHTKTCSACNCFITEGHTYGGYSYGGSSGHSRSCTGCGHVESAGHTLTYTLYSGLYHITSCSICGYSSTDYHNIEYEQYNASYHDQYCTLCGHIAYISHSWSNRNHNASTHTRYCATCEQTSTAAHTCTYTYNSSTHTYSCTVCGYVQSSGNHSFTYGSWTSAGKGVKKRTVRCTVCNYSYVEYS